MKYVFIVVIGYYVFNLLFSLYLRISEKRYQKRIDKLNMDIKPDIDSMINSCSECEHQNSIYCAECKQKICKDSYIPESWQKYLKDNENNDDI